jgi:cytidylate kinase
MDRDSRDAKRALGPLAIPKDSQVIDTTSLSLQDVVDQIVKRAQERRGQR